MFVHRPDASLHTLGFGSGSRHLVAIGGWVGSGEVWLDVIGRLGPEWHAVVVDHRGSGVSSCTADRITIADMVSDLLAVLDAYRIDRAVIAAESAGAGVALQAALDAPERIAGLALISPAWMRPSPGSDDAFIAAIRADFGEAAAAFAEACLPEETGDDIKRWGRAILERSTRDRAIQLIECRTELTVEDHLSEIGARTFILHGSADAVAPVSGSRRLAAGLVDARLEILDGLGHAPVLSRPHLVAEAIQRTFGEDEDRVAGT